MTDKKEVEIRYSLLHARDPAALDVVWDIEDNDNTFRYNGKEYDCTDIVKIMQGPDEWVLLIKGTEKA